MCGQVHTSTWNLELGMSKGRRDAPSCQPTLPPPHPSVWRRNRAWMSLAHSQSCSSAKPGRHTPWVIFNSFSYDFLHTPGVMRQFTPWKKL